MKKSNSKMTKGSRIVRFYSMISLDKLIHILLLLVYYYFLVYHQLTVDIISFTTSGDKGYGTELTCVIPIGSRIVV